jgi:hypothetical protein
VAQWITRLTTNQKIAGSSPARIDRILCGKDLDRLVWQGEHSNSYNYNVRGPVAQWTMRLTMNQKIAGSSPARINMVLCGKDLDRLVWLAGRPQVMSEVLWRNSQCV